MKTIFEEMGGTFSQVGDYLLPNLMLPAEEKDAILGRFGIAHKAWLKSSKPCFFSQLIISATLFRHCKTYPFNSSKARRRRSEHLWL